MKPETAKNRYISWWKREYRRKTFFEGSTKLAYNVPGTTEFWVLDMLMLAKPDDFVTLEGDGQ